MGSFDSSRDAFSAAPVPAISFAVPDGRLTFGPGDLDRWAEHLVWCYRLLGIAPGTTIAVQDYGSSPLSFLASALLTPTLRAGVAERLGGRVICLDASPDRVALTPALSRQVGAAVLVIRGDVAGLVIEMFRREGMGVAGDGRRTILALSPDRPRPPETDGWPALLLVERAMLLAPQCGRCGGFRLRADRYRLDGRRIMAPDFQGADGYRLPASLRLPDEGCPEHPDDAGLRFDRPGGG